MQGLPACGKTARALELVADTEGVICDPQQWFELRGETFRQHKLTVARRWAWHRCMRAAKQQVTPIVVDMHVGVSRISIRRLHKLRRLGYEVELVEPNSDDWQHIKILLLDKRSNRDELNKWASILAERSHHCKYTEIRTHMNNWVFNDLNQWV